MDDWDVKNNEIMKQLHGMKEENIKCDAMGRKSIQITNMIYIYYAKENLWFTQKCNKEHYF